MEVIAVLGAKSDRETEGPAVSIPRMLQQRGCRIIPINPQLDETLGERCYPDLASVPERFDVVDVFRRPAAIPDHVDEIVALPPERRPKVVWLQSGIRHDEATERLLEIGIDVVQDACLGVLASRFRA